MDEEKYYLAYGSNLNLKHMRFRCPSALPIGSIMLSDYKLVYRGSNNYYAYLTIEKEIDSYVPMGLYKLLQDDISFLDMYEGYPSFYSKIYIPLSINNKNENALIYVMNNGFDYHLPSPSYVKTCMDGYKDFGFDMDILNKAMNDTYEKVLSRKL